MQTLQQGATLQGGKYIIKKDIGQGGFGITYLAEHSLLGTKVAIKEFFMKELNNRDESTSHVSIGSAGAVEQVERFRNKFVKEARNIARLNHPNIIKIHDIFEENGTAYYVMEYCENGSLSDVLKLHPMGVGEAMALKYIRQVASALQYIHSQKMNHLDVKPANIMLNSVGDAILIDFGLSKQYDSTGSQTSTTPVGISHGFAPIEQYKQGGVSDFSPATDIYSLGATLYKLVTGQTPPDAQTLLEEELPDFSATESVKNAIRQAMQVKRSNRPQTIEAWLQLLNSSSSNSSANNYQSHFYANSTVEDEATRIVQPAWKEEEERRQREQAEKERKAKEEARRHAEEIERISREAAIKAEREAREKEIEAAKAAKAQAEENKKKRNVAIWFIAIVVGLIGFLAVFSNNFNNSSTIVKTYSVPIESMPTNAALHIDGIYVGTTPYTANLSGGSHHIRIVRDGYEEYLDEINVNNNVYAPFVYSLKQNASTPTGFLNVKSNPSGAEVYVDGKSIGKTPLKYSLSVGKHNLILKATGYEDKSGSVDILKDTSRDVNWELTYITHKKSIKFTSNPQGAEVLIDGKKVGTTPLTLSVTSENHNIIYMKEGYDSYAKVVDFRTIDASFNIDMKATGTSNSGTSSSQNSELIEVAFFSEPTVALLRIDGEIKGYTPINVKMRTGNHKVTLEKSGYKLFNENKIFTSSDRIYRATLSK